MTTLLTATNLAYQTNDGRMLAFDMNLHIKGGDLCILRGPNGSGKTTLLRVLLGLHPLLKGQIACPLSGDQLGCITFAFIYR